MTRVMLQFVVRSFNSNFYISKHSAVLLQEPAKTLGWPITLLLNYQTTQSAVNNSTKK